MERLGRLDRLVEWDHHVSIFALLKGRPPYSLGDLRAAVVVSVNGDPTAGPDDGCPIDDKRLAVAALVSEAEDLRRSGLRRDISGPLPLTFARC